MMFVINFTKKLPIVEFDVYHSPYDMENIPTHVFSVDMLASGVMDDIPKEYKKGMGAFGGTIGTKVELIKRILMRKFNSDKYIFENVSPMLMERIKNDVSQIWSEEIKPFHIFSDDELTINC